MVVFVSSPGGDDTFAVIVDSNCHIIACGCPHEADSNAIVCTNDIKHISNETLSISCIIYEDCSFQLKFSMYAKQVNIHRMYTRTQKLPF